MSKTVRGAFWLVLFVTGLLFSTLAFPGVRARIRASDVKAPMTPAAPSTSGGDVSTSTSRQNSASGNIAQQRIEAEIITISPSGFHPAQISRPKGPFVLEVEDRSGLKGVDVQFSVERGNQVFQVEAPRENPDWNRMVDLPPGRYVLNEVGHPDWTCTITITPQ